MYSHMQKTKYKTRRVTVNLPAQLVESAIKDSNESLTNTIISALTFFNQRKAYDITRKMIGKLHLNVDIDASRER